MRYYLSVQARIHLKSIGQYTEQVWGTAQRRKYLKILDDRFHDLAAFPTKGRARDEIQAGLRSWKEGKHLIFYFIAKDEILVVGLFHERMDPALHLKPKTLN